MDSKKLAIIGVAVVLVVVIAAAAFMMTGNDSDDTEVPDDGEMKPVDSRLPVYGNANNDLKVDSKDVDLIKKIIDKKESRFDFPLADANMDGKVDSEDVAIVEKIIGGEKTPVYFIDHADATVCVNYPMKNIVTINEDVGVFMLSFDAASAVAGYGGGTKNPVITAGLKESGGVHIDTDRRNVTAEGWQQIKDLDIALNAKGEGIDCVLVDRYDTLGDYRDDFEQMKIPAVVIRITDPWLNIDGALLTGFLCGPEIAKNGLLYLEKSDAALKELNEKIKGVKDKTPFLSLCMTYYVAEKESQYTLVGVAAGGKAMTELNGESSTKLESVEAITKYDDKVDVLLNMKTMDADISLPSEFWEHKNIKYLEKSAHFQDMAFINLSMPGICKSLYAATVLYPELVETSWVDGICQDFIDTFMDYLNKNADDGDFDVTKDTTTVITWQDWQDEKKATA